MYEKNDDTSIFILIMGITPFSAYAEKGVNTDEYMEEALNNIQDMFHLEKKLTKHIRMMLRV